MSKVILITGASRGFGKLWAEAFLKRGDKVVATARNVASLESLVTEFGDAVLPLALDVNDRQQSFAVVEQAKQRFGRIDVVINNAGYGVFGAIEETSEAEARAQIETNFFGTLWLTQAVLPLLREQKSGHIIQVSSVLGLVTAPVLGLYNASKFAVEGLSETLAAEVKPFGIHVTIVEPNAYETDWSGTSAAHAAPVEAYAPLREKAAAGFPPEAIGKPVATTAAILKLVDTAQPPLRLLLGKAGLPLIKAVYAKRLAEFDEWKAVSDEAHGH